MEKNNSFKKVSIKDFAIIGVLVVVIAFFTVTCSNFLTISNMTTILQQVASVCCCSLGMMFILIIGDIDLSVGYMASAVGMFSAFLMTTAKLPMFVSLLITMIVAIAVGAVQGIIVSKLKVVSFIVTMAFMNALKGFSYLITSGKAIYDLPDGVRFIGQGKVIGIPVPVLIMIILVLVTAFFTNKVYLGRYFYAVGSNEEASKLAGIDADKVRIATFMMSAFFACIAGFIMMGRLATASPNSGDGFEFDVITACVLGGVSMSGGKGRVYQAAVGAIIIAVLNNGMIQLHIDTYVQLVIKGTILLLAVIFDSYQQNKKAKVKVEK